MNKHKSIFLPILLFILTLYSCKEKEDFPDLAKEVSGNWKIYRIGFERNLQPIVYYNPTDSAQVANLSIEKLDPLTAKIHIQVKKSGVILYEYEFGASVVRDQYHPELILFEALPGRGGGGYNREAKILSVTAVGQNAGKYQLTGVWLDAKR